MNGRGRSTAADLAVAAVALLLIGAALEVWTSALRVPGYLVPAPSAVVARLARDWLIFLGETAVTVSEAAGGFAVGAVLAFGVASAMTVSRALERSLFPVAILVKLTPIVAVAPLFTLWFGFGAAPKVAIAALITFFPMLVNAFVGLRSVDPQELAFLQTLGASRSEIFWRLRAPSALPYLFSAARISANLALIGAVVGEWTGADRGLGRVIFVANANLDLPALFSAVLLLAAVGIAVNALVGAAEQRVLHWHPITLTA
jgi:NitT/TauT family transport system permease protein